MSQWFCTDNDCLQHCRPTPTIDPEYYDFVQINHFPNYPYYLVSQGTIDLKSYSEEDILSALNSFGYKDMDDFVFQNTASQEFVYKEDGTLNREHSPSYIIDYQLIAEMLFEEQSLELVTGTHYSWDQAVSQVEQITGLNLEPQKDHELLLVSEVQKDSTATYLLTPEEFIGPGKMISEDSYYMEQLTDDHPATFRAKNGTDEHAFHVQLFTLCDPIPAVHKLANILKGDTDFLISQFQSGKEHISPGAQALLPKMLSPILEADIGQSTNLHPMKAIEWEKEHKEYVEDLDTVLQKLNLIDVQRHRSSVTQGEVSVLCNGQEVVRYGDTIKLKVEDLSQHDPICCTDGAQYGDVLGSGWGSVIPDTRFRHAALTQYADRAVRALTPSNNLEQVIQNARDRQQGNRFTGHERTEPEQSR